MEAWGVEWGLGTPTRRRCTKGLSPPVGKGSWFPSSDPAGREGYVCRAGRNDVGRVLLDLRGLRTTRPTTHGPRPTTHGPRTTRPTAYGPLSTVHTQHDSRPTTHDPRPTTHDPVYGRDVLARPTSRWG